MLRNVMVMLVANLVQRKPLVKSMELPPPRRVTDEVLRSPVTTGTPLPLGSSVAIHGLPEMAAGTRRWSQHHSGRPNGEGEDLARLRTKVVTKAVRNSRSGDHGDQGIATVTQNGYTTQVKITDDGPRQASTGPHLKRIPMQADEGDHGGFGLCLVTSLATRWGVLHEDEHTTVWF